MRSAHVVVELRGAAGAEKHDLCAARGAAADAIIFLYAARAPVSAEFSWTIVADYCLHHWGAAAAGIAQDGAIFTHPEPTSASGCLRDGGCTLVADEEILFAIIARRVVTASLAAYAIPARAVFQGAKPTCT
jgi:hypothetical protein